MKKIFAIIALFALVFTSCQKEETMFIGSGLDTITATIESTNDTKATLDGSYNVVWSEDDEISVFVEVGESVYNVLYTLSSVNSNGTGVFTKTSDHDISGGTIKAAIYPYDEDAIYTDGSITNVSTKVQHRHSINPEAGSMAAKVNGGTNIAFKNIGALVKVTTPKIPSTYSMLKLSSETSFLSGDYSVSFNNDGIPAVTPREGVSPGKGAMKHIILQDVSTSSETVDANQTFYFRIFTGNYSDLTVKAIGGEHYDQELVLIAPKALTAERSKLYYTDATFTTYNSNEVVLNTSATEQNIEICTSEDEILIKEEEPNTVQGKVNISINSNESKDLTINLPSSTVLLSGNTTYSQITASTADNTLILGNGVTVTLAKVEKGNIQVNPGAKLNGISRGESLPTETVVYIINNAGNDDNIDIQNLPNNVQIVTPAEYAEIKLREAASKGGTHTLTSDVTLSDILWIKKSLVLDLNGHTLEGTSDRLIRIASESETINVTIKNGNILNETADGRCVETRSGNVNLTLDGVTISTPSTGKNQPLTIGGSGENILVNIINNSNIATNRVSGYAITTFNPVTMNIENSIVEGWCALNVKVASSSIGSAGSVFNVKKSTLKGENAVSEGETNGFTTIMIEDKNVTVNVDAESTVIADATNANAMSLVCIGNETITKGKISGTNVTFASGATLTLIGDNARPLDINEGEKLDGNTFKFPASFASTLNDFGWATSNPENDLVTVTGAILAVASSDDLAEAVESPNVSKIIFKSNITLSDILWIKKSLVLDLNGHTLEGTSDRLIRIASESETINVTIKNGNILNETADGRCVETRSGNVNLTLDGVTISTPSTGKNQPLTIGGSGENILVNIINNSNIATNRVSGYAITTFNPVTMNIENSNVEGWCALNVKVASSSIGSAGSVFNVKKSILKGANAVDEGESNGFTTIMIEDKDVTLNIDAKSTVIADATNGNEMSLICIGNETVTPKGKISGTKVTIASGATLSLIGDNAMPLIIGEGEKLDGNTFKFPASFASTLNDFGWATSNTENNLVTITGSSQE